MNYIPVDVLKKVKESDFRLVVENQDFRGVGRVKNSLEKTLVPNDLESYVAVVGTNESRVSPLVSCITVNFNGQVWSSSTGIQAILSINTVFVLFVSVAFKGNISRSSTDRMPKN